MADRPQRMLSAQVVLTVRHYSRATLYKAIAAGRAATPVKLGPMRNSWPQFDPVAQRQARTAERDARAIKLPEGA
jgi:predicted DNA-binding transcriptional regulator AlpA